MNSCAIILLLALYTTGILAGCTNKFGPWTRGAPIPQFHQEGQPTVVVGTKLYVVGAFGTNDLYPTDKISIYDFSTNNWTTPAVRTPFNSSHVNGAFDGRYIYMIAGFQGKHPGNATKVAYRFDTVTEKFESLPDLPAARASAAVAYDPVNKRLHYIGGLIDRNQNSDKHWSLDVTAPIASMNWTEEAAFPQARNHLQGIFMNGTIYLAGGQFGHDNNPLDQDLVHSYNTETKRFDMLPKLPSQRSHAEPGTLEMNGRLVIFGGREKAYPVHGDFVEFNPVAKTWEYLGKLPDGNWINPSVGFFRNATKFGDTKPSNWVVITAGGRQYNDARNDLFFAEVTFDCNDTSHSPPIKFWGEDTTSPVSSPVAAPVDEFAPVAAPVDSPQASLPPQSAPVAIRSPIGSISARISLSLALCFLGSVILILCV
eukprot:TRINITY_DN10498_c0_g1_i1.p1 TRINITY_DN10498_c0_g1~~TRINITY_DN10498_c0_g1_i1.p1  ORF type:complete len:427 (-),score=61.98 TRINITY_DN10498_c0_g1_i1:44-1324(-)